MACSAWPCAMSTTSTSTPGRDQRLGPLEVVADRADRRPDQQPALGIAGGARVAGLAQHLAGGDQAAQPAVGVHQRQLFEAMLVQDAPRLHEAGPDRRGDQRRRGRSSPR